MNVYPIRIAVLFALCICCSVFSNYSSVAAPPDGQSDDGTYRVGKHKEKPPPPPALVPSEIERPSQNITTGVPAESRPARRPEPTENLPQRPRVERAPTVRGSDGHAPTAQGDSGSSPTSALVNQVLTHKIGSARLNELLQNGSAFAVPGKGSSNGSWGFDHMNRGTGEDNAVPTGSRVFQGQAPAVNSTYQRGTARDAQDALHIYGSIPTGVVLEGVAQLEEVDAIGYDPRVNALTLGDRIIYLMRVPPKGVAVLCRAIARDDQERIGVALTEKAQIEYGKLPKSSDVAWDLKMADHFLGDIVFAQKDWSADYRFADGFAPEPDHSESIDTAVFFKFTDFSFEVADHELRLVSEKLDVKLLPLSQARTSEGGALPDEAAIAQGRMSVQYEENARHVASHIDYYRRERIVDHTFAYGEVAAVLRALKRQGFDLEDLADHIPGG
jgi:hypothetical protein